MANWRGRRRDGSSGCRSGRGDGWRLARLQQPGNRVADLNDVTGVSRDAAENPVAGGLDFDHRLVGLHLEEHLALANLLPLLLQPRDQLAGLLRHFERRHHDADSHQRPAPTFSDPVASARAAAAIISTTCGLRGASVSRIVGSGPPTVTNGAPATSSSSAGNRVMTS